MPPQPGQRSIPLKDWRRFLRVADWFERTIEHGKGVLPPVYGEAMIVKTPEDGIDARDDDTLYSATCVKCVAAEIETPGEKILHETNEELRVYNVDPSSIAGESYVKTILSANGTRYALPPEALVKYCTIDDHPGMGVVFEAYAPGVWNPATHDYDFTCDADHTVKIIDRDYAVPTPGAGSQGYGRWETSDDHGRILVVVTMDCDSRGSCCG